MKLFRAEYDELNNGTHVAIVHIIVAEDDEQVLGLVMAEEPKTIASVWHIVEILLDEARIVHAAKIHRMMK
jgi:hypothetical protein